jgi:hypothetical protein
MHRGYNTKARAGRTAANLASLEVRWEFRAMLRRRRRADEAQQGAHTAILAEYLVEWVTLHDAVIHIEEGSQAAHEHGLLLLNDLGKLHLHLQTDRTMTLRKELDLENYFETISNCTTKSHG